MFSLRFRFDPFDSWTSFCLTLFFLAIDLTIALLAALTFFPSTRRSFFGFIWPFMSGMVTNQTVGYRQKLMERIKDGSRVLEIGPGIGPNFKFMPKGRDNIVWEGTEPNPSFGDALQKEAAKYGFTGDRLKLATEDGVKYLADMEDNKFDYIVMTMVLCSVPNPKALLQQVHRVLKPGGELSSSNTSHTRTRAAT